MMYTKSKIKRRIENMHFVISDIHGNYEKYCEMLDVIGLKDDDVLYVLGDVTDRGENGIMILQDMMRRPNVIPILGNHDVIAWRCLKWLAHDITEETIKNIDNVILKMIDEWFKLGGDPTVREFMPLSKPEREDIIEYFEEFRLYEEVNVGGKTFLLVHGGFEYETFDAERSMEDYDLDELVWARIKVNEKYFPDKYLIFGHTPTCLLWAQDKGVLLDEIKEEEICHKIFKKEKLIGVDCGCGYDGYLGCLCLETMEEYYV